MICGEILYPRASTFPEDNPMIVQQGMPFAVEIRASIFPITDISSLCLQVKPNILL